LTCESVRHMIPSHISDGHSFEGTRSRVSSWEGPARLSACDMVILLSQPILAAPARKQAIRIGHR